jgi:hypothetical protein
MAGQVRVVPDLDQPGKMKIFKTSLARVVRLIILHLQLCTDARMYAGSYMFNLAYISVLWQVTTF